MDGQLTVSSDLPTDSNDTSTNDCMPQVVPILIIDGSYN